MSHANIGDTATAFGIVRLIKRNAEGIIIEDRLLKNQLTNYARSAAASLWIGNAVEVPSMIHVGNGSPTAPLTGVDASDTAMWANILGKSIEATTVWLSYSSQYSATFEQTEANSAWTEIGLLDANMNMWSHVAVSNFTKSMGETVTVQWQVLHIGN